MRKLLAGSPHNLRPQTVFCIMKSRSGCRIQDYFFTVMTVSRARPSLTAALDGDWMLIVVSTPSVSILSTLVSGDLTRWGEVLLGVSVSLFLLGALLYILLFTLVLYRFLFFPVDPIRFTPPLLDHDGCGCDHYPGRCTTGVDRKSTRLNSSHV